MILMNKNNIRELESFEVKESLSYNPVPEDQQWRIGFLREMIDVRAGDLEVDGFSVKEISEIIENICTS